MSPEIISIVRVVKKEVLRQRKLMTSVYVLCSAIFLVAAINWPKIYTSSATILVDSKNILQPLMAGTAETTEVENHAGMANKIVFSQKSLKEMLASEAWAGTISAKSEAREIEILGLRLGGATSIRNVGENLIEISYSDNEPLKAFETTQLMTDIFIRESLANKRDESQAAYKFIDDQVSTYHRKLKESESAIKEFRSKNIDASESAKLNSSSRLIELKRELETVELDISSAESLVENYRKQLSGESSFTDQSSIARESQLNARIAELDQRLSDLKLNYHDTYPDIVKLKGQIEDLKDQLKKELTSRDSKSEDAKVTAPTGEAAQLIQSQIFTAENNVSSLNARKNQILRLMDSERGTLDRISDVEAEVAELTRDYEVNQDMYQSLLNQRENARISMNIDLENKGRTLKVQEPATIPVTPKGIRFGHIILAGIFLSFVVPVVIIYGLTLLDQKVRTEPAVYNTFDIPVLASVSTFKAPSDRKKGMVKLLIFTSIVLSVWAVYGITIYYKLQG